MGQKVHPISYRIGINQEWNSYWSTLPSTHSHLYSKKLSKDLKIRQMIEGIISLEENCTLANLLIQRASPNIHCDYKLFKFTKKEDLKIIVDLYIYQKLFDQDGFRLSSSVSHNPVDSTISNNNSSLDQSDSKDEMTDQDSNQNSNKETNLNLNLDNISSTKENVTKEWNEIATRWSSQLEFKIRSALHDNIESSLNLSKINLQVRFCIQEGSTYLEKETHFLQFCFSNFNAHMLGFWICMQIQKRKGLRDMAGILDIAFKNVQNMLKKHEGMIPLGFRMTCSGRFLMTTNEKRRNKMARQITFQKGTISLTSIDKEISYSSQTAYTVDGTSGVKIWIAYGSNNKNLKLII